MSSETDIESIGFILRSLNSRQFVQTRVRQSWFVTFPRRGSRSRAFNRIREFLSLLDELYKDNF